jgi:hypothetical protein
VLLFYVQELTGGSEFRLKQFGRAELTRHHGARRRSGVKEKHCFCGASFLLSSQAIPTEIQPDF